MNKLILQSAMLKLMDALADDIIKAEAVATELEKWLAERSLRVSADALHGAMRSHRVKALELRGQLAALRQRYAEQFLREL